MKMNQDFKDLLSVFNDWKVEYLVVGAHALAAHGHVRATKDFDVWVNPTAENGEKVFSALAEFGAPVASMGPRYSAEKGNGLQIGMPPVRIGVITSISGVEFAEAWPEKFSAQFAGVPTQVISLEHLKINKEASGRSQDLADLEWLNKHT